MLTAKPRADLTPHWALWVIARDMAHWQQVYRDRILTLPHIAELDALMLVATIKDSEDLAL